MGQPQNRVLSYLNRLTGSQREQALQFLEKQRECAPAPSADAPTREEIQDVSPTAIQRRLDQASVSKESREMLLDPWTVAYADAYRKNIEYFGGTVKIPIGLAGPLLVDGLAAGKGTFWVPLATTEAALVASYNRGMQVISAAGGCTSVLLSEGVGRSPGFVFTTLKESVRFASWVTGQIEEFRAQATRTTRYGRLADIQTQIEGNHVYLLLEYETGDASGQNMATFATQAICEYIATTCPVKPRHMYIEANMSGDKKATAQSYLSVRGRKVSAEVTIPEELVVARLHTTPVQIVDYYRLGAMGAQLSGALGIQGHFANGLAALYLACGLDVACVAESAVGVARFEVTAEGDLYGAVTLPSLLVATVGGGTHLPSQFACLNILGLAGSGNAAAFAELCAAVCLAGEISLTAAMCNDGFVRAHQRLARPLGQTIGERPHV